MLRARLKSCLERCASPDRAECAARTQVLGVELLSFSFILGALTSGCSEGFGHRGQSFAIRWHAAQESAFTMSAFLTFAAFAPGLCRLLLECDGLQRRSGTGWLS